MTAAVAHLVASALYAGFQWTVRVVVYPQLATAARAPGGAEAFPALEAAHGRRVSRLVGPAFAALVGATAWLVATAAAQGQGALVPALAAACCTGAVLAATALGAVPQHRRLARAWDAAAHRRLLRWDTVRTAAASTQVVLAVVVLLG